MRVLLHTGRGGVGTTTVAAAGAVHAARSGARTLVVSTTADRCLAHVLGRPVTGSPVVAGPVEVEPGLSLLHLGARAGTGQDAVGRAAAALGLQPWSAAALPGVAEFLALTALRDEVSHGGWDVVVVDCGAAERALRLLTLPDVLARSAAQLLLAQRSADVVGVLREVRAELTAAAQVLGASSTSVRLVVTPQPVVVAESLRTLTALSLHGFGVDALVANMVAPAGADPWLSARADAQAEALAGLAAAAPAPVLRAPHLAVGPVGTDALAGLAVELFGHGTDALLALEPPPATDAGRGFGVERTGSGFDLVIDLPLTTAADVDLARAGDDLVLTVGHNRRVVVLPSALRRCRTGGARMSAGRLRVHFEPDPSLWPTR